MLAAWALMTSLRAEGAERRSPQEAGGQGEAALASFLLVTFDYEMIDGRSASTTAGRST